VRELLKRGIAIDRFAPRIAILVNCRMDFFEEIAKIRATRRLFSRMMGEEFGARDPRSLAVNIAAHTSGLSLTAQQPVNNVVRGATQALALALAGAQAIEVSTFDEGYRIPSAEAHLVGLRTQQVIQLESGATRVADPLGGSYYVESLTDELERRILDMVTKIESMGTLKQVSESGWFRQLFQDAMTRRAAAIQDGSETQVGLNAFEIPEEEDTLLRDHSESKLEPCWDRIDEIRRFKDDRDAGSVAEHFARVREAGAAGEGNLIEPIADAFEADLTQGEIAGALRLGVGNPYDPLQRMEPPA
jgi:methylmalonyl-CoA mutase N-terminal domain/subunit